LKKILLIIPNLGGGGAEKVLITLLNRLDLSKYKITLLLIFQEGIYLKDVPQNVNIKYLFHVKNPLLIKFVYKLFRYISPRLIYKFFIKEQYNVEIAFLEGIATKLVSGSTNPKSQKIAWVHTDLNNNHLTRHYYKDTKNELEHYKKFNKIVCVSNDAKNGFIKLFNYNPDIEVIYNPIDSKDIVKKANEEKIYYEDFTVCSIGRLVEVKGMDRLLRVHAKLIQEGVYHKLNIIGSGPLELELKALCEGLDIKDTVYFQGFQTNPYKFLAASNIFVSSSLMEGFSLVVAEALILGKPVLSTKTSGPSEILANGKYGKLVENSEDGLYKGLKELILNPELCNHFSEMATVRKDFFDLSLILGKIENMLK
jgi:glycosyltransferase involved in cell wall biosynthesis